jgi:hypothetical protein
MYMTLLHSTAAVTTVATTVLPVVMQQTKAV